MKQKWVIVPTDNNSDVGLPPQSLRKVRKGEGPNRENPVGRHPESSMGYPLWTVRSGPDAEEQVALGSIYRQARNSFLIQRSLD